jgi:hypothetical protein
LSDPVDARGGAGINHISVRSAVVKTVQAVKTKGHREETVRTVESDKSRVIVFVAGLCPRSEDIARPHHSLWRYYRLDNVGTVVTDLPVETAVRKSQWDITAFGAAVVTGDRVAGRGHCDWHGWNIHSVDKARDVASNANVGAAINKLSDHGRCAIKADAENAGSTVDVGDGTPWGGEGIEVGLVVG